MSLFSAVLHKLQKNIDAQNSYKTIVITCITEVVHVAVSPDAIVSLKDGVLVLHTHPTIKMAILLKKDVLIKKLQEQKLSVSVLR